MNQPKVLAFCGSLRKDSWNKKLMLFAVKELEAQGAQVKVIDLNDLNFPIFNEDEETQRGLPDTAEKFIKAIKEADGLVIASPEYNGGVTAALKNTIDWATRGDGNPFHEKPILVMGTSPGAWGAIKSSLVLRQTLVHIQAHVLPNQVQVPLAEKNIGADGALLDPAHVKMCHTGCRALLKFIESK